MKCPSRHSILLLLALFFTSLFMLAGPACQEPDTTPPYPLDVSFAMTTATTVQISWTTTEVASSQVEYGPSDAYGQMSPVGAELTKAHLVELTDLIPGQVYHYRVISIDAAGNEDISRDDDFIATRDPVEWPLSTPEEQGIDSTKLEAAREYAGSVGSKGIVVIRNGKLVAEWYWDDWDKSTTQRGYSMAKSFTSALIGMCLDEGLIQNTQQKAADFIQEWPGTDRDSITLWHLLSMTSGLDSQREYTDFATAADQGTYARNLELIDPPETKWHYLNAGSMLLAEIVQVVSGKEAEDLARERLFEPLGMLNASWLRDSVGNTLGYQSVVTSARGFAKFGQLYLDGGVWEGKQIVSKAWVDLTTQTSQNLNPGYGLQWWTNTTGALLPNLSHDIYMAMGYAEKRIHVIPSRNMVTVRLGDKSSEWDDQEFLTRVLAAVTE